MFLFILKSSACLASFILFYRLCLEKMSVHVFKRFYLLGALLLSIVIPLITFTQYIEVKEPVSLLSTQNFILTDTITNEPINIDYKSTILWSIYVLGVVLFLFRFFKNLFQLNKKIRKNVKFKNKEFINVLLNDLVHPHTFLNYIFLNKTSYEKNQIPDEVLLHEQTHVKQKHTLDILFIELLQIILWFNPLLYVIKKDIKLNHEFLADQAVLKKGVNYSTYQKILLAFASSDSFGKDKYSLVNAINYSLIKKRFTVMKTQTSRITFWLRSLLILPVLCMLIYSFSSKNVIEKPIITQENNAFYKSFKDSVQNKNIENYVKARVRILNFIKEHDIDYPLGYLTLSETDQKAFHKLERVMLDEYMKLNESERKRAPKKLVPPPSPKEYELIDGKLHKKKNIGTLPPPPPPHYPMPENPSKALLEAKKKYDVEEGKFVKLMQLYINKNKGTATGLKIARKRVMVLYEEYSSLSKKEIEKE